VYKELFQGDPILRDRILEGGGSIEAPSQGNFKEAYHKLKWERKVSVKHQETRRPLHQYS